jgi:hypothetical protein
MKLNLRDAPRSSALSTGVPSAGPLLRDPIGAAAISCDRTQVTATSGSDVRTLPAGKLRGVPKPSHLGSALARRVSRACFTVRKLEKLFINR